jgi:hypothetical protein
MDWRGATIAWYRLQIEQMQQAVELMEGGVLTTGEMWEGGQLEARSAELVTHYKSTIDALTAAINRLEGEKS